tara:strand:- start:7605 stop:8339 length:735 start_codon:yes stop_codon:yes gene_type:complete
MQLSSYLKETIFYIDPLSIIYCTHPSNFCEYTQFGLDRNHPHAGRNRGYFKEDEEGKIKIIDTEWDVPGIKFEKLPEYIGLYNHYHGKENWRDSEFAFRMAKWLKSDSIKKNFNKNDNRWKTSQFNIRLAKYIESNLTSTEKQVRKIIIERENEINELFNNILKKGVLPCNSKGNIEENFINNISINLGSDLKIFFNNRGQHRLSIAKIIKLKKIPVKISVIKNILTFEKFVLVYKEKNYFETK